MKVKITEAFPPPVGTFNFDKDLLKTPPGNGPLFRPMLESCCKPYLICLPEVFYNMFCNKVYEIECLYKLLPGNPLVEVDTVFDEDQQECYRLIIHGKEHLSYIQKYGCNPDKYYRYLECGQELRDYCMCEKCFKSKLKDKCNN